MSDKAYDPNHPYDDERAPFLHLNQALLEEMFGVDGPYSQAEYTPNWLRPSKDGYELVRLDEVGDVVAEFGLYITIGARKLEGVKIGASGGKAVAYWNYKATLPANDNTMRIFSDNTYQYIIAYKDGYVAMSPLFSGPPHARRSTLLAENQSGRFPIMPFVALAFFQWLETDEGRPTLDHLKANADGWAHVE